MSIKSYNPATGKWEKKASSVAKDIKILNSKGKFKNSNVDSALNELMEEIENLKNEVKRLDEEGTRGGGGYGGGSAVPTVTVEGSTEIIVNTDDVIDIFYYFTSPNVGSGMANLTINNQVIKKTIPQGRNKWTVGPFSRGVYNLSISVQDKQGFWTVPATIKVISGSITLSSSFNGNRDFALNEDVIIPLLIETDVSEDVFIDYKFNGVNYTVPANIGDNTLNIGKLPFLGVSKIEIKAKNSRYESNVLKYNLVAADSENLFMSSTFQTDGGSYYAHEVGKVLNIDYRISMKGQFSFKSDLYVDGNKIATVTSFPGVNFWNVGDQLNIGSHTLKIVTKTVDGTKSYEMDLFINIVSSGFTPYQHVRTGLIAEFDANGKLNNSENKNIWEDKSGKNVLCELYGFNYYSNGWIDNTLVFSGKSYAKINIDPFKNGVKYGFTLDILLKNKCVGNVESKILHCKNPLTPFQGISVNTYKASISTKTSLAASAHIQDDTWTKVTYVIDRTGRNMIVYINGVISSFAHLDENDPNMENYEDEFTYDGKILLGAGLLPNGEIGDFAVGAIKNIRIYDRALTDDEVVQNYIADFASENDQKKLIELNNPTEGMPTMNVIGLFDGMSEGDERVCQISYTDPKNPSKTFVKDNCVISWQGTSSLAYPVKNYTIQLKDGGNPNVKYTPKDNWKGEKRWTLKANYMDSSSANSAGLYKFIHDFFLPNPYPSQIADPTNRATPDGFPIKLSINGEFVGIYTWNIDRYSPNNYGFVTYNDDLTENRHPTAVSYEISTNDSEGAGAFKIPASGDLWDSIKSQFKCRYNWRGDLDKVTEIQSVNGVDTQVLKQGMHNELVELVSWVANATDEQFYAELKEHFSIPHLIDYYLITYVFGLVDSFGKNMVLSTWGKNANGDTIWYPSFYDCDTALGLNNSGIIAFDAGLDMADGDYNTSTSTLWVKLNKMFKNQIKERYHQLRLPRNVNGELLPPVFSPENIMKYLFDEVIDSIGQTDYNKDMRKKYFTPEGLTWSYICNGNRKEFTKRWLEERFIYMDSVFEFNYHQKTVIRSYAQGNLKLRIKTYSPQHILVSFFDATDAKVKKKVGKHNFVEFEMYVSNGTDNNIEIYGSNNIMYIEGIDALDVRSMNIGWAEKLIELDLSNNTRIQELELGNNSYLRKLNVKNCTNLGKDTDKRTLDLSNCTVLSELDCSNTHIANIQFSQSGGVLEKLNCSYTDITTFTLNGQQYLESILLTGCENLSEMTVTNCNGLKKIIMPNTKLSTFVITGCELLEEIDISQTKSLRVLDLRGCPNLKKIVMIGVSNPAITDLDLTYQLKLEYLDISSCGYISTLTFGQYTDSNGQLQNFNALKTLKCKNSAIKSIRYGKSSQAPDYLDLAGLNLTELNFSGCANLTEIRNINLVASGSSSPFNNCYNLTKIQGYVKLKNSIYRAFYNCSKLEELPNLDLSEVTSISETFMHCNKFNINNHLVKIMVSSNISSNLTSTWKAFAYCSGLSGTLPENLFSRCTELKSIERFFEGCSNISGSLPTGLLAPMRKLENASHAFYGTKIDGELPNDFFRYNVNLKTIENIFANTKLTTINPSNVFRYNANLQNVKGAFSGITTLQLNFADTANIFKYNTELVNAASLFSGCPGVVGSVPANIFNNIPKTNGGSKVKDISYMLSGTNVSGSIPAGLFDNLPLLEDVSYFFSNTQVSGDIPTNLFANNNNLVRMNYVFNGLKNLTGTIQPNMLTGKTKLTSIAGLFKGCENLNSAIPDGFLDITPGDTPNSLVDVSELFYGCSSLFGQIPRRFTREFKEGQPIQLPPGETALKIIVDENSGKTVVVTKFGLLDKAENLVFARAMFYNCYNLTSEIPETLFINGSKITHLDNIFGRCVNIFGPIPKDLFKNCRSLVSLNGAFADCRRIRNYVIDEDNPYCLPETLFSNCFNLVDISNMFSMWGGSLPSGTPSSMLNGKIPATLFSNCLKLSKIDYFMVAARQVTGEIPGNLFQLNTELTSARYAFAITGITGIGNQLFSTCKKLKNLSYTFCDCSQISGVVPEFWSEDHPVKATVFEACYRGLDPNKVTNYNNIPSLWK